MAIDAELTEHHQGAEDSGGDPAPHKQQRRWRGPLERYKAWVRAHPGLVGNLDLLSYLVVYNPLRSSGATAQGSVELTTESCHALVGLLSLWHQSVIDEELAPVPRPAAALWLDAVEQVETIIELRGMHLEQYGRMSRYGPLTIVEIIRALLKTNMWSPYPGHLFLRHPGPEDIDQFESEQGLSDVLAALERLRLKYSGAQLGPGGGGRGYGAAATGLQHRGGGGTAHQAGWGWLGSWGGWGSRGRGAPPSKGPVVAGGPELAQGAGKVEACVDAVLPWPLLQGVQADAQAAGAGTVSPRTLPGLLASPLLPPQARLGADLVWLGEVLHIWRPVVYVSLLHRYGRGSWRPWLTSLAVDLLSMHFTHRGKALLRATAAGEKGPTLVQRQQRPGESKAVAVVTAQISPADQQQQQQQTSLLSLALARGLLRQPWTVGEVRELADRRRQQLLYLVRSPALDWLLRPLMESLRARTQRIPLVGLLADYTTGLLDTLTMYYTYTRGS